MRIIILSLLLIINTLAIAQTTLRVEYVATNNGLAEYFEKMRSFEQNKNSPLFSADNYKPTRLTVLLTDGVRSVFTENAEDEDSDELTDDQGPEIVYVSQDYWGEQCSTFKDFANTILTIEQYYVGRAYVIEDPLRQYNWSISTEKQEIAGFECIKATCEDTITAWFTPEIPVSDGPSTAWGLPGLILKLDDSHEVYTCASVEESKDDVPNAPKSRKKMSMAEFREFVRKDISTMGE